MSFQLKADCSWLLVLIRLIFFESKPDLPSLKEELVQSRTFGIILKITY